MIVAASLMLYAAALSWCAPALLTSITRRGINPKLGVAAWLTTAAAVITAWLAAVIILILDVLDAIPNGPAWTECVEIAGYSEHIAMARPLAATTATSLIIAASTLTVWIARRIVRALRAVRSANHQHAVAARVIGHPTQWRDVVVVNADHPAAYCIAGRPRAIVVTSAALASLRDDQLAAVLAHEQAHLSGRHHQILMLLRAAGSALPAMPLAVAGPEVVPRLLEMCADDSAARRHGSRSPFD